MLTTTDPKVSAPWFRERLGEAVVVRANMKRNWTGWIGAVFGGAVYINMPAQTVRIRLADVVTARMVED